LLALSTLFAARSSAQGAAPLRCALELAPFESPLRPGVRSQLVPVQAGESVFAASALCLFALDARTLEARWGVGPPRGWEALAPARRAQLLEGIDHELAWSAPGVGAGVVVAALQLPSSRGRHEEWDGIVFQRLGPERRLFAFDAASGAALWDHGPELAADDASHPFARGQNVFGAPLVRGESVLVACASDPSSIDYRVASYALASGAFQWASFVVRGQVERRGPGQQSGEYSAPPLALTPDGARVLALTGLGTLACLDAATGALLWSTPYPAEPLPGRRAHMPPRRTLRWRAMPPLVSGDVVLAAPVDARALFAFDLADGCLLWSLAGADERGRFLERLRVDHLAGVEGATIYLGGPELAALRCVRGLRDPGGWELVWTSRAGTLPGARARLVDGALFAPDAFELRELDARTGTLRRVHAADATLGLLVEPRSLFALGAGTLERLER
jgi:outer membrane protein assembly factor BamB